MRQVSASGKESGGGGGVLPISSDRNDRDRRFFGV